MSTNILTREGAGVQCPHLCPNLQIHPTPQMARFEIVRAIGQLE